MAKVSVSENVFRAMETFAESIEQSLREDIIEKLAAMYGFDAGEAKAALSGGVQLSKEVKILPLSKLPYCGPNCLKPGHCKAIAYTDGLYNLCPEKSKDGDWCTKCAKQVAKNGTPNNGDIEQREACDYLSYKVGKRGVKPYWIFMQKHGITPEQVLASAEHHGVTIDPHHLEPKSIGRGRPATSKRRMETPLQELPVPAAPDDANQEDEVDDEAADASDKAASDKAASDKAASDKAASDKAASDKAASDKAASDKAASDKAASDKAASDKAASDKADADKADADKAKATTPKIPETNELEEGELEEEEVEEGDTYTADEIEAMPIGDLRKLAESCAIATTENGKPIVPKRLRKILCEHFQV